MGAAGSPGAAFERACEIGNVLMAVAVSAELPRPLVLEYALKLTACFARADDVRFDAAAVRLLGRLMAERDLTLAGARLAADALAALPDESAMRVLRELVRKRLAP
jgi:hypothetical protein